MAALLADAAGRRLTLISTKEGAPLYTRLGFKPFGYITQHQAVLAKVPPIDIAVPVRAARDVDRPAIAAVDERASGMDRRPLLAALMALADTVVVERDRRDCRLWLRAALGARGGYRPGHRARSGRRPRHHRHACLCLRRRLCADRCDR
jgi:hypothetical protein